VSSKDEGIVFNLKPVAVGGTVTAQMSLGGVVLYEETFTGQGHDWETVVVPLRYVLEMRDLYGLDVFGLYEVRFTVPSGPDNGVHVFFDEITLATISYQPPQPSD